MTDEKFQVHGAVAKHLSDVAARRISRKSFTAAV